MTHAGSGTTLEVRNRSRIRTVLFSLGSWGPSGPLSLWIRWAPCIGLGSSCVNLDLGLKLSIPHFIGLVVGVLGPTAHPGLPLKVFLGVGRCQQL
jgi:hypothetical protein